MIVKQRHSAAIMETSSRSSLETTYKLTARSEVCISLSSCVCVKQHQSNIPCEAHFSRLLSNSLIFFIALEPEWLSGLQTVLCLSVLEEWDEETCYSLDIQGDTFIFFMELSYLELSTIFQMFVALHFISLLLMDPYPQHLDSNKKGYNPLCLWLFPI